MSNELQIKVPAAFEKFIAEAPAVRTIRSTIKIVHRNSKVPKEINPGSLMISGKSNTYIDPANLPIQIVIIAPRWHAKISHGLRDQNGKWQELSKLKQSFDPESEITQEANELAKLPKAELDKRKMYVSVGWEFLSFLPQQNKFVTIHATSVTVANSMRDAYSKHGPGARLLLGTREVSSNGKEFFVFDFTPDHTADYALPIQAIEAEHADFMAGEPSAEGPEER